MNESNERYVALGALEMKTAILDLVLKEMKEIAAKNPLDPWLLMLNALWDKIRAKEIE